MVVVILLSQIVFASTCGENLTLQAVQPGAIRRLWARATFSSVPKNISANQLTSLKGEIEALAEGAKKTISNTKVKFHSFDLRVEGTESTLSASVRIRSEHFDLTLVFKDFALGSNSLAQVLTAAILEPASLNVASLWSEHHAIHNLVRSDSSIPGNERAEATYNLVTMRANLNNGQVGNAFGTLVRIRSACPVLAARLLDPNIDRSRDAAFWDMPIVSENPGTPSTVQREDDGQPTIVFLPEGNITGSNIMFLPKDNSDRPR